MHSSPKAKEKAVLEERGLKPIIFGQLGSTEPFPVDFDDAWQWLQFSRKDNAKTSLLSEGFVEGFDFLLIKESDNHAGLSPQEKAVAARKETIKLTVDCFKIWAMRSPTERGREVRLYYLEVEKQYKKFLQESKTKQLEAERIQSRLDCLDWFAEYIKVMEEWLKRHPEKKGSMWSYHQHCQNGINRKLTGTTAHGIEKYLPILWLVVKRDYYNAGALENIGMILQRFCNLMRSFGYDYASPVDCMKTALENFHTRIDISVDSILISEAEAKALADYLEKYPSFDYEDFMRSFEESGSPRNWKQNKPLKASQARAEAKKLARTD